MAEITKIEPDNIKDSVVEIKYSSSLPNELVLGIIFEKLKDSFQFIKQNAEENSFQVQGNPNMPEFKLEKHNPTILHDNEVSIKVMPGALIFNCQNNYLTWPIYFKKIKAVLIQLNDRAIFDTFTRVGLRYVNEYINFKIEDIVNFIYKFGIPDVTSDKFNFTTEFKMDDHLVILNIIKNTATSKQDTTLVIPVSIIDIDVINQNLNTSSLDDLFSAIDKAHKIEKIIFFQNLLKEGFKKTLKITLDA